MKNILFNFESGIAYAELHGNVELKTMSHAPDNNETGTAYEVTPEELKKIKKSKRKAHVVAQEIISTKQPLEP